MICKWKYDFQMLNEKANVNESSLHIQNWFVMERKQSAVNAHKLTLGTQRLKEMGSSVSDSSYGKCSKTQVTEIFR